ncbi:MAG: ATP cone domain-containing protein [Phycisphaerae bacterium]
MSDKIIHILKRDGTAEPFEGSKLGAVLRRAMIACEQEARLAEPLVRAVAIHLEELEDERQATTQYIFRCVRSVLRQTGLQEVADELTHHAQQRDRRRRNVRVLSEDGERRYTPFKKAEVARLLTHEFEVGRGAARIIAGRVERQIFGLQYKIISRMLLIEIVRNELMAWGLDEPTIGPSSSGVKIVSAKANEGTSNETRLRNGS